MACARIQSKPVRFLNANEKLISDLREEIKRLGKKHILFFPFDFPLSFLLSSVYLFLALENAVLKGSLVSGVTPLIGLLYALNSAYNFLILFIF